MKFAKLLLIALLVILAFVLCQKIANSTIGCSDFDSQQQAQVAYANGARHLDRDNDNKPCEKLKR